MCFTTLLLDLFSVPLFDAAGLTELLLRTTLDLSLITALVRGVYYRFSPNREVAFTYFLFNILIFFICYLMSGVSINMGFGFGLFAIFGILRYRTAILSIKEMTYLLAVIVLAVLNAVSSPDISLVEQIAMGVFVVIFVYLMERIWYQVREGMKEVRYEKIELIRPDMRPQLIADLQARLGLKIHRIEVSEIDLLNDSARLLVYYELDTI
jgi:hypothetical protein